MVGFSDEGSTLSLTDGAEINNSVRIQDLLQTASPLEQTPEQAARRQLGSAMACSGPEPIRAVGGMLSAPQARSAGNAVRAAVVLLLALVGASTWFALGPDSDDPFERAIVDVQEPVTFKEKFGTQTEVANINLLPAEPLSSRDVAPEVTTDAPIAINASFVRLETISLTAIEPVRLVSNLQMPNVSLAEEGVLVFADVPSHPEKLLPSFVTQPVLPVLVAALSATSATDLPKQIVGYIVKLEQPTALLQEVDDRSPQVETDPHVRIIQIASDVQIVNETNTQAGPDRSITAAAFKATRAAPRRSVRPTAAPSNRSAIARQQFARSAPSRRIVSPQPTQAIQVQRPQIVSSTPIKRPELIAPQPTRLQRIFKAWGSQPIKTVEQFASEHRD